ncbi:hypothetical protein ACP_2623 [Acidobacterium capsulatum ATCC 51196]|uniref:Uncharacterized protein n=1 Tax=Acidobacterium capsulatum (strain ATCC 51196 / DSM 11244 / BCRC 80197 / JCM 7670 / NBRC 15755 / NCIMB 13165 / 161) TaxID=240015 RepID=C1F2G3_ACIC5|nr:hypothetical protein ACP_2623 [Acidobacterium capsulatum ATCC 51196]
MQNRICGVVLRKFSPYAIEKQRVMGILQGK